MRPIKCVNALMRKLKNSKKWPSLRTNALTHLIPKKSCFEGTHLTCLTHLISEGQQPNESRKRPKRPKSEINMKNENALKKRMEW